MEIRLQAFESLDSTNNYLKKLAAEGAAEGMVVIADEQTAGRGRMGRSFASAAGCGIYMSMLLRPADCADRKSTRLNSSHRSQSRMPSSA